MSVITISTLSIARCLVALIEALNKFDWDLKDIALLNVGGIDIRPTKGNEKMVIKDIKTIINCFMSSETQIVRKSCRLLLGSNYVCVNYVPDHLIKMDNASKDNLRELEIWGNDGLFAPIPPSIYVPRFPLNGEKYVGAAVVAIKQSTILKSPSTNNFSWCCVLRTLNFPVSILKVGNKSLVLQSFILLSPNVLSNTVFRFLESYAEINKFTKRLLDIKIVLPLERYKSSISRAGIV